MLKIVYSLNQARIKHRQFVQTLRIILSLALIVTGTGVFAALDSDNLRAELEAMESRAAVDPVGALGELMAATPLLASAEKDTRLWYLLRRAQVHNALFMYDEFERDIDSARALGAGTAPPPVQLWLDAYLGLIQTRQGNLELGVATLTETARLAREQEANRVFVFAVTELAFTRGVLQRYDESLLDLQSAYKLALELQQPDLIAGVNDAYAAVYGYMLDYPRALEYYHLALKDLERIGHKEQIASVVLGLASTYRYAGDPKQAEHWYLRYLEATRYAMGKDQLFYGHYGLAMTYAEQEDCQRALPQLQSTLEMRGPKDYKAELFKYLARCEAARGNFAAAETALKAAADILHGIPELAGTTWILDLKQVESSIEYFRGNTKRAYELMTEYHNDYILQIEKGSSNSMNMLRADLEHDRKDLEIALLEGKAQLNQLQVETQSKANKLQRYLILLSLASSLVILAAFLQQKRNNRRILALSHRDSLSGLYNRRYTFEYLERVVPQTSGADNGLSIILMDIDNFKGINDMHGHPTGDAVIQRVAAIGEQSLRNRDIMGRIGGEEFLCVLPRATAEQSLQVAQRLLDAISSEVFSAKDGRTFSVSMSIGIAHHSPAISDAHELYTLADSAMYQSKKTGKGRITTDQPR